MIRELRRALGRPLVVGHRGAMAYAPENTLASFQRAVELGADVVECDVHLTLDEVPVVIHDTSLDRTTSGSGPVAAATLAHIRALDAGAWFDPRFAGERVPTLDEALEWARGRVPLALELKGWPRPAPALVERVARAVVRGGMLEQVAVISFDHPALAAIAALAPGLARGVLYACRPFDAPSLAESVGAEALLPHWCFVVAEDVERAHAAGLAVQPWESSDPEVLAALLRAGVDGVGTNRPDVARRVVLEITGA